jgi:hypothetical protein
MTASSTCRHERARRFDLLSSFERAVDPEQRLLDDVLGLGDAAQHPVGDRERDRPWFDKQLIAIRYQTPGLSTMS